MKKGEILNIVTNVLVLVAATALLLRPESRLWAELRDWRANKDLQQELTEQWPNLTEVGERLDRGLSDVAIVEFSDFQCPYCREAHDQLRGLLEEHPDIGILYRHYPIRRTHPHAEAAARAAICAGEQGRFREMHDHIFAISDWNAGVNWEEMASRAAVPHMDHFGECLQAERTTRRLETDLEAARAIGVTGTPTFIVKTGKYVGALTKAQLLQLVERSRGR